MSSPKRILITGANSGIGKALTKRLAIEKGCHVFLGSRNLERGLAARQSIVAANPSVADLIEVVELDVSSDASVQAAATVVQSKLGSESLYAVVNNAGAGFSNIGGQSASQTIFNVNVQGPKRVKDAFVSMLDQKEGRIVNTSSGAAPGWLKQQDAETKKAFTEPASEAQLLSSVDSLFKSGQQGFALGYGLSKAALNGLTVVWSQMHPNLTVVCLSPGLVDTGMTAGWGNNKLTPEQGCKSSLHCLFGDVTSGWFYGSDALRSPFTVSRDPGTPEYQGEPNPDPARYNR